MLTNMMNLIVYCDGTLDLLSIAEVINVPVWELYEIVENLLQNDLIKKI